MFKTPRDDHTKWSESLNNIYLSYVESNLKKWYKWSSWQNRDRLADVENKLTKGEMSGQQKAGQIRSLGWTYTYTIIYKIDNQQGPAI